MKRITVTLLLAAMMTGMALAKPAEIIDYSQGRFEDRVKITRSHTLPQATAHTATVLAAARQLLAAADVSFDGRAITLVGVAVANLDDADSVQLALPFTKGSSGALDEALDVAKHVAAVGGVVKPHPDSAHRDKGVKDIAHVASPAARSLVVPSSGRLG